MARTPLGLAGWQWMLIAEALPTILLGMMALFYFPDRLEEVRWLSDDERRWLKRNAANRAHSEDRNDWRILRQPMVWASALIWFCLLSGTYGILFWLPLMINQLSRATPFQIGLINALPWVGAMLGMYYNSRHSDRTAERFYHIAAPAVVSAVAMLVAWRCGSGGAGLVMLFVTGLGLGAAQGAFWALPTSALDSKTFAVAAVAINIAGSSGGLIVPHLAGYVRERSGSFLGPTLLIAAMLAVAALLVICMRRFPRDRASTQARAPNSLLWPPDT